jgi:AmmeMemoRadiSam system protein A
MELSEQETAFLLKTACWTIRRRLDGAANPVAVPPISPNVMERAGCFVSLHRRAGNALRGCIGRIDTAAPLLEALINAAWGAARDPRFVSQPVTTAEIPELLIELSILGPLRPAATPLDFDPPNDGLYLSAAGRSGVFLPQVARETGWSREQLLDRLTQEKLGLPANAWRDPRTRLFKYPAQIIGPLDFLADESPFPAEAPKK